MALDSRAKRAAVLSVGRPWMRGINPDATAGAEWRSAVANTYPVKAFEGAAATTITTYYYQHLLAS
jgi:hypothetical protein